MNKMISERVQAVASAVMLLACWAMADRVDSRPLVSGTAVTQLSEFDVAFTAANAERRNAVPVIVAAL